MSVGTELATDVVRASLERLEGPTEKQVEQICHLSHYEDTRNDMQDVIDQVLKSPSSYAPHKVHNVLNLMKSCLAHAAPEFVTFCIAQLQFMQAGIGSPVEVKPVTPTTSMMVPLTPPESPTKYRRLSSTPLPAPDPRSPKSPVTRQIDPEFVRGSRGRHAYDTQNDSVLLFQKDKVAGMTFMSGKDGLELVSNAVDDLRKFGSPMREHPEDLLTALETVHHCLYHGSAQFVEYCVENIFIFSYLRRQSSLIKPIANTIFDLLTDKARLDEKRHPPQPDTRPSTSSRSPKLTSPKAVRISTKSPLLTPKPTPPKPSITMDHYNEGKSDAVLPGPRWGLVPSASLFLLKKEEVAMMSFQREGGKMAATLMAVNDLKRSESSLRRNTDQLVQALKCVLYCLVWGSAPFVARCREQRTIFNLLRQHSSPQVRDYANAIFNFVKDYTHLHDTAPLIRHAVIPPPPFSGSVRENPENTVVFEPGLDISKYVRRTGTQPSATGFSGEIWAGLYGTNPEEEVVAIKFLLQLSKVPGEVLQEHLDRELSVWRSLFHTNISPFYGIVIESATIGLVLPHYPRGNVLDYVKMNSTLDPSLLLQGIADGVLYLHANGIVHGDIKSANVMVTDEGIPRLIDFGITQVIDVYAAQMGYNTSIFASSLRWSAPELFSGYPKGEKSDVYAVASTYIEIITQRHPYSGLSDAHVLQRVKSGGIPPRPTTIHKFCPTDNLWRFLTACWEILPRDRPNIVSVRRKFAEI